MVSLSILFEILTTHTIVQKSRRRQARIFCFVLRETTDYWQVCQPWSLQLPAVQKSSTRTSALKFSKKIWLHIGRNQTKRHFNVNNLKLMLRSSSLPSSALPMMGSLANVTVTSPFTDLSCKSTPVNSCLWNGGVSSVKFCDTSLFASRLRKVLFTF